MNVSDYEAIARSGVDALRRGDGAAARAEFDRVVASGSASHQLWLFLAQACEMTGDGPAMERAGKAMIFDDSIEHAAWNDSDQTRVVLLFEIWRPALDAGERKALTTMLEAINAY